MPVQRAAERCAWLKRHGRCGRNLPPAALESGASAAIPEGRAGAGKRRRGRAHAGELAHEPSRPPAGQGDGRRQSAIAARARCAARLRDGGDARRRNAVEGRDQAAAGAVGGARAYPRQVGRGRSRPAARTLEQFEAIERRAADEGLSFGEAMRLLAGRRALPARAPPSRPSSTGARPWPGHGSPETLARLRRPDGLARVDPGASLQATLRPYQHAGVQWLHLLAKLRLGACLADDMGLGKTIQVLSLLLVLKREAGDEPKPSLLVAPASLLANWAAEIARFAPSLKVAHRPSFRDAGRAAEVDRRRTALPMPISSSPATARWRACPGSARRLGDWSFSTKLRRSRIRRPSRPRPSRRSRPRPASRSPARRSRTGSATCGRSSTSSIRVCSVRPSSSRASSSVWPSGHTNPYAPLRDLVRPYILRRLKTDKSIIADLPDKTEVKTFCPLSRKQAALYSQAVEDLADQLERGRRHAAQGAGARLPDAAQADLQPSLAVARRRRLGGRRQRQARRDCATSPR